MKKFRFVLFLCVFLFAFLAIPTNAFALSTDIKATKTDLLDDISGMFGQTHQKQQLGEVVLGGIPIGISLNNNCVEILGFSEIITEKGACSPASDAGFQIGDKILQIDNKKVHTVEQVNNLVNNSNVLKIDFLRNNQKNRLEITPAKDVLTGKYKLGMWIKDQSNGIGTLTFVKDGKLFGSLGHPITSKNGDIVEISGGKVHDCVILGVNKGTKGDAGELKGTFNHQNYIGDISKNNKFGVYGKFNKYPKNLDLSQKIQVANICDVKPGKAQIYSTIEGETPKFYDVEIIKATNQMEKDDKGMVIRVVDKTLLDKTGGIVQGMSGSPIIQNGKLVGAVTHVFINDPTKGFAMFAQWMLQE